MSRSIAIAELEEVLLLALEALKQQYGPKGEIPLEEDFYWSIPEEELYTVEVDPTSLTIGQLTEDCDMIRRGLQDRILGFHLLKASHLLRYISHTHSTLDLF